MRLRPRIRRVLGLVDPDVGRDNQRVREAWLEAALRAVPAGRRILDAGAGTQQYRRFCGHLRYVSQDFGQYDGQGDAAGLQTGEFDYGKLDIVSDITEIPEADRSFDAVMCVEVLEHVPRPDSAVAEFSRLLRPGGELIVTAPFCSLTHMAPYHFATGLSRYWYETHLPAVGLQVVEITPNGNFFEFLSQELRRLDSTATRYAESGLGTAHRLAILALQRRLRELSRADSGSHELLCFGYHVRGVKPPG